MWFGAVLKPVRIFARAIVLWGVLTPHAALAALYVAEVAWMGSLDDANSEWIELFNDGEETNLTGWTLSALDGQPHVELAGIIRTGEVFLLERTDDATIPEVSAGQVYTGGLGNGGEVVELRDAGGVLVDRVDGSNEWAIGGNNETKETLQRLGSFGAWVTAAPTPGRVNAQVVTVKDGGGVDAASSGGSGPEAPKRSMSAGSSGTSGSSATAQRKDVSSAVAAPALTVSIGSDRTVSAGVPVHFVARARDERGEGAHATYTWSFGDGATGDGAETIHTYPYEGEYVVVVRATRSAPRGMLTSEDRAVVWVVPLTLALPYADTRSIEVANDSAHEVDLSRFTLVAGTAHFRIPEGTILLSGARVRFAAGVTKLVPFDPYTVGLFTPMGVLAARYEGDMADEVISPREDTATSGTELVAGAVGIDEADTESLGNSDATFDMERVEMTEEVIIDTDVPVAVQTDRQALALDTDRYVNVSTTRTLAEAYGGVQEVGPLWWWLTGLAALVGATGAVVFVVRHERNLPPPGLVGDAVFTDEEMNEGVLVPIEEPVSLMSRERRGAGSGRDARVV